MPTSLTKRMRETPISLHNSTPPTRHLRAILSRVRFNGWGLRISGGSGTEVSGTTCHPCTRSTSLAMRRRQAHYPRLRGVYWKSGAISTFTLPRMGTTTTFALTRRRGRLREPEPLLLPHQMSRRQSLQGRLLGMPRPRRALLPHGNSNQYATGARRARPAPSSPRSRTCW